MPDTVLYEKRGAVALLTLNRPDKLNALNYELIDRLMARLDAIEADAAIRAVVLTGAGERAFSSGADIACFAPSVAAGPDAALRDFVRRGQRMTARIETFPKPIIVAVNGLAHGGGSEITEAAPLAIASERAEFCKAEIRLGFAPPFGGSQRLPRLIGRKRALRMILTGEPISAERALEFGLVNEVVRHEDLLDAAFALAEKIAGNSMLAVAACLGSVTRGINVPIDEGLAIEAGYFARMAATQDIQEGIAAFLEKREPRFTDS
ncbi:MAG TPA: crotonase/enoyl-CoA hydratase family protein [Hyphomicrobiales bacterium]|nr:crotonase/enoyl-CoA hydratase family protein [Rhodobiaceae bacterium]HXK54039.1 crotonase/enoyl-CoA hydratase family protein [Hyphomicrobiales bacterium]